MVPGVLQQTQLLDGTQHALLRQLLVHDLVEEPLERGAVESVGWAEAVGGDGVGPDGLVLQVGQDLPAADQHRHGEPLVVADGQLVLRIRWCPNSANPKKIGE